MKIKFLKKTEKDSSEERQRDRHNHLSNIDLGFKTEKKKESFDKVS